MGAGILLNLQPIVAISSQGGIDIVSILPNFSLFIQIAIILVLMFLLNILLFKPMLRVLNERKARTVGRRERAAQADAQADAIMKDYQTKINEARIEADKSRIEIVRQGEAERNKITEAASAEAEKTVADVKARVSVEAASAKEALKVEIDAIARTMAEKIVGRAV